MDSTTLDDIILRLLDVRSGRPGKQVQLSEAEIRQLCLASKDIFLAQPNLLELEAPIKICGRLSPSLPARQAFRRKVLSFLFSPLVRLVFSLNTLGGTFGKWSERPQKHLSMVVENIIRGSFSLMLC
jgi:hypothetical protein